MNMIASRLCYLLGLFFDPEDGGSKQAHLPASCQFFYQLVGV
jgi:hypothetical protein